MTEHMCGVEVYTLDCVSTERNNSYPQLDRHLSIDLSKPTDLENNSTFGVEFEQIVLDFVWFNPRYWAERLGSKFFKQVIPILYTWLIEDGYIYLPACAYFLLGIYCERWVIPNNSITLLDEPGLKEVHFHVGTRALEKTQYHSLFEKESDQILNQDTNYCLIKAEIQNDFFQRQFGNVPFDTIKDWLSHLLNGRSIESIKIIRIRRTESIAM